MFCPVCGTLAPLAGFATSVCPNYKCDHVLSPSTVNYVQLMDGKTIDTFSAAMNSHSPANYLPPRGPSPVIDPHRIVDNVVNRVVFEDLREMHQGCEIWAMTMYDVYNYG